MSAIAIIDANNLLYRMFHTQPPRSMSGQRVESVIAALNSVNRLSASAELAVEVDHVIVVHDGNQKTFRHDLSEHYKAERKGMPEELKGQEVLFKLALKAQGVPTITSRETEADDIIASIVKCNEKAGKQSVVISTDKDLHQLISDQTMQYNPASKKMVDRDAVMNKYGIEPKDMALLLALAGDKSDGICGVDGVGVGKAAKLIKEHGSLASILSASENIKGVLGTRLREAKDRLALNMRLAEFRIEDVGENHWVHSAITTAKSSRTEQKLLSEKFGLKFNAATSGQEPLKKIEPTHTKEDSHPDQELLF